MLSASMFNFQYFVSGLKQKVNTLMKTKNITCEDILADCDYIREYNENIISVYIPSNINNVEIDNTRFVNRVYGILRKRYTTDLISCYKDTDKSTSNDITVVSVRLKKINENDIKHFVNIGNYLKDAMQQKAITITINDCLALV